MEGIVNYLLINTDVLALCCLRGGLRRMRFLISALVSEIMGAGVVGSRRRGTVSPLCQAGLLALGTLPPTCPKPSCSARREQ